MELVSNSLFHSHLCRQVKSTRLRANAAVLHSEHGHCNESGDPSFDGIAAS